MFSELHRRVAGALNKRNNPRRGPEISAALKGALGISVHEKKITEALSEVRFDGTAPVLDKDLCILAFSNRSGSNFLGEKLASLPGSGGSVNR